MASAAPSLLARTGDVVCSWYDGAMLLTRFFIPVFVVAAVVAATTRTPAGIHDPLPNAANRATPLSFGLYVSPDADDNPIDPPERFSGYHAAEDFEVSAGELDGDVPVYAICSGRVIFSGYAEGYGGLLIHRCKIEGQDVTVLYGHLKIDGMPEENAMVQGGDTIGLLADARSYESGMNRKHLHLGIHKGKKLALRGYVQTEKELEDYVDPATVLPWLTLDLPGEGPGEVPYWQE